MKMKIHSNFTSLFKISKLLLLSLLIIKLTVVVETTVLPKISVTVNISADRGIESEMTDLINTQRKIEWNHLVFLSENYECQQVGGDAALSSGGYTVLNNIVYMFSEDDDISADVLQCMKNGQVDIYVGRATTENCALTFANSKVYKNMHFGTKSFHNHLLSKVWGIYADSQESKSTIDQME